MPSIGRRAVSPASQPIDQGTLITWSQIARYCGVCVATAKRWAVVDGLPVGTLPDGRRATTKTLIDSWILARMPEMGEQKVDAPDIE